MKIVRMNRGSWGKVLAFFDIETDEGFIIKGFKIVEGNDGRFVSFPSREKDGEYHDTVWADKELKQAVSDLVKGEYDNPSQDQTNTQASSEEIPF